MQKPIIVLLNLGGPDSPESIEPFLQNFFSDPAIIGLPGFLRRFLAKKIAKKRSRGEAKQAYDRLGGKSPLLENTLAQSDALVAKISQTHPEAKVMVSMRYWHPMSDEIVQKIMQSDADGIVLLPLYPQFSTTTSGSSFKDFADKLAAAKCNLPVKHICCYPLEDHFVNASAKIIKDHWPQGNEDKRLLFSAHGLPEKVIKGGDPYQWQNEQCAQKIVQKLDIPDLDWQMCYQSRVGPLKWIGPSIDQAIKQAADDDKGVVIYPIAFVSEHVETLVELDEEYHHIANDYGVSSYTRIPTLSTQDEFIETLADLARSAIDDNMPRTKICPNNFKGCWHAVSVD